MKMENDVKDVTRGKQHRRHIVRWSKIHNRQKRCDKTKMILKTEQNKNNVKNKSNRTETR